MLRPTRVHRLGAVVSLEMPTVGVIGEVRVLPSWPEALKAVGLETSQNQNDP